MNPDSEYSLRIQYWIQQLGLGNEEARRELVNTVSDRLLCMTRKMLRSFPNVHRWEQTEDVFQNATIRLWHSLKSVELTDARHFFRIAGLQIRRELLDLARHYHGPQGMGAFHATHVPSPAGDSRMAPPGYESADKSIDPQGLAEWSELHEQIGGLPDNEREVFELIWYHELTQTDVANLLGVDVRTVKRRWRDARLHLQELLSK